MSENTHTPIPYWKEMRLTELRNWIIAANKLGDQRKKAMEQARKNK